MTTLAIVVTLVGQAWAENANGERRALEVGDQLAVDETLIMAEGARIDLDFGDNQQLTFLGEQQVTPEVRGDLIEQTESLSSLETNDLPEPVTPIESDRGGLSEGHRFVQLVRIGEIIEADGYTPVTVARIQEVLRPFGMSIPQQEFVRGSERDGTRYDEQSYPETGLKLAKLSISIDAITGDDIVDATEAGQPVTLTGTVGGGVSPGDTVAVTVNGQLYNTTVNADGRTWQVDVPGSELAKDNKVQATVNSVEPNGTPVSESAERPYWADDITPSVSVELEQGSGPNGEFNESDTNDGKVEGRITFGPNSKPGDTITVTDKDGNPILDGKGDPITDYEITQGDIDNGITVEVPVTPGQTDVELKVDITDSVGNTSSASDNKAVDNVGPQLRVEIEGEGSIAHYDAAKITNGQAKVTVKLIAGAVEAGDQLIVRDGNGNTVINRPVTDAEVASGEVDVLLSVAQGQTVVNVEAVITDPAGNSSNDTDGKVILSPDLAIDTAQIDDAAGTIDISGSTSDVAPGSDVVITITDKDGNTVSVTAQTNASGDYTITGQDISGLTDGPLDIKAETTDHNGKTVDDSVADAIDHIAGGLSVDTTTVASTGPTVDISGSSTDVHPGETVTVTITDQDGTTVTTSAIVQADGTYTVIGTDISSLVDGPLTIDASATDNNGNPVSGSDTAELDSLAGSMTVAFTNDPIADPALAEVTGTTADVAPGETVSLTFTDVNNQTTTATAVVASDGTYTTTVDLRGLTDGDITVDAAATDRNGDPVNATNNAELDAIVADIAIKGTSVDDVSGTIDISGSTTDVAPNTTVNVTITDKDNNTVTTIATTDANGDYVVNGTDISGLTDGDLTITAETTDHNGNPINATATDALDYVASALVVDTTTVDDASQTVDISGSTTDVHPGETVTVVITDQDGTTVTTSATVQADGTYTVTGEDISSLVDGPLTIDASATDNNGNPVSGSDTDDLNNLPGSMTVAFTNDPIADPALAEVTGTTVDVAPGETVSLTFTDVNNQTTTATAVVASDGTYTSTVDLRGLTDGTITVDATATDRNSDPVTGTDTAELDAVAAAIVIDATNVDDAAGTIDISGSTTDVAPGSDVDITITDKDNNTVTVTVQTDGTGNYTVTGENISGLTDGPLDIKAETTDHNGNLIDDTATDALDYVSGDLAVDTTTVDDANQTVDISGSTTDVHAGETVTITIKDQDGNTVTTSAIVQPDGTYTVTGTDISSLVDGPLDITAEATDNNGNPVSGSDTAELDNLTGSMTVTFTNDPIADPALAEVTGTTADVAPGETVSLTFTDVNNQTTTATAVVASDGTYTTTVDLRGLTDGDITVDAAATDRNSDPVNATNNAELDAIVADIAIDSTSVDDAAGTIDISGSTTDVAPGELVTVTITDKDGGSVTAVGPVEVQADGTYSVSGTDISGLTDGALTITAETTDHNNNPINATATDALDYVAGALVVDTTTVDDANQTVDISGSTTDVHPGETVTVAITDQDGTTVTTSAIVQPDGTYTVTGEDISSLVDGPLTIDASATDNNGNPVSGSDTAELDNLTGSMTVTFTNDPIADPALAEVTGTTADVAPGETVSLTFTDVNNQTTTATAVVASDGTYTTTVDLRGLTDGDITVDAAATDRNSDPVNATNNAELDAIVADIAIDSTSVDDAAGTIDISGSTTDVAPGELVTVTITDKDGGSVTAVGPVEVQADGTYSVSGTDISGLTDGALTITAETTDHNNNPINATATDALDYVAGALVVDTTTVDDANQTVDISGSTTDVHPGETVTVVITDQDGNTVTTSAIVQPDGTYTVTGEDISSLVDGPLTIDASATDNNGNPVSGSDTAELDNLTGSMTVAFTNDPIADPSAAEVTGTTVDVAPGETVSLTFTDVNGQTRTTTAIVDASGNYTATIDLRGLTDGDMTVDAAATDRNSDPVNATNNAELDAIVADIAIDSTSVDDAAGTIDISGSTTDVAPGELVTVTITDKDGGSVTAVGPVEVQADGTYSVSGTDISGLTDGALTITAETTDHNNNPINATATDALDYVAGALVVDTTTVDDANQTVDISGSTTDVHPGETVTVAITDQDGTTVTTSAIVQPDGTYTVTGEDISSLVDGPLTIDASATDNNGNPVSGSDTAELDNLTGSMTVAFTNDPIADPSAAEVTGTTVDVAPGETVSLTFTDVNGQTRTTTAIVDASGNYTATIDLRGLTDGDMTVDAAATDRNSDPVNATNNAELDAIVADIAIDSTSVDDAAGTIDIAGSTTDVAPNTQVNITITDKDGGVVTTTATTDANGDYVVTGTDISGLIDGDVTITANTVDHNNNTITDSATDTLDNDLSGLTVDTVTVDNASQLIDISGNTTDVFPGETVTITIKDQDGTEVTTTTTVNPDGSYDVSGTDISSLVDGPLEITAESTDNNGEPVSGTGNDELDNIGDTITVTLDDITSTNESAVTVSGTTADVLPGETVDLTFSDGTNITTATATVAQDGSYVTVVDLSSLGDGLISVDAEVDGRNQTVNASDNATKDVLAPSLTITSADSTLADTETTEITFTFSEAVTGFDATDITVAGGSLTNLATTDNITWTADFTADGTGDISIQVPDDSYTDVVGNLGTGNNHAINTAPTASDITLAAEDAESFVYEAEALFTDADGDSLSYSATGLPAGLSINPNTGLITGDLGSSASQGGVASDGTYTIEVTVNDGQGGTNTAEITLNVTNPVPVVTATIEDKTFDDSDVVSIQTSQAFNDQDGDTITYSASNLPGGLSIDNATGEITGTLDSSASQGGTGGDYTVTITANDGEGGSVSTDFTISVNNPAPVVDPVIGITADDGQYVEIQTQFTDPDSDVLSYRIVSGAPTGFTIDASGKISGTLASNASQLGPDNDGYYHIVVEATDADGALVTDTIELLAKNPAPVIDTPLVDATADDGATFTLSTSTAFNDPDGDTLTYSVTGLPSGLTLDPSTGEITGTLSKDASQHGVAGDGKYTIVVTADDGQGGTVSDSFELDVSNTAPDAINDTQSTNEGDVLTVDATNGVLTNDTDSNGDNLTVTAVSHGGTNVLPGQAIAGSNGGIFRIYADGSYDFDPNGEYDSLAVGESEQSSVTYTVSDGKGGTDTATLEITINGVNNPPVAEDDQVISDASGVTIDVLNNDSDVDTLDMLTITEIDGTAISVGSPVTTTEGVVTLNGDGTLTFVPDSGFTGNQTSFDYTISDSNGGTDTATVKVDVVRVNITDDNSIDASLAQQNTPDGTLASIDDLSNTEITGSIPQGGSVVSLVISDGTNTITVDPNTIAIFPNGSFTTTVDTTGFDDGNISVNLVAQNSQGDTGTSTDTIYKDTVTDVEIDPLNVVNGEVPVVTGTGEPGATVVVSVDDGTGKSELGRATVNTNGDWSFTPTNAIDPSFEVIADATDEWGNIDDISRNIPSLDTGATVEVDESGLAIGSDAGNQPIEVNSSFTLGGTDAIQHIVVDGTTVTKAELEDLAANPVTIIQGHYTVELTGYNSATGEVNYTYTLTDAVAHDAPTGGSESDQNIAQQSIQVSVVDTNGDTRTGEIAVEIKDDVPSAPVADAAVSVEEGAASVGSANSGDNLLANDTLGADGGQVHDITYVDRAGDTQTNIGVPATGLTVDTQYGELTVNQDGSWSYTPVDSANHVKATNDTELSDDFSYRVIDSDGDISSNSATQKITVTDTDPAFGIVTDSTVDEASLALGSNPDTGALTVNGNLPVAPGQDTFDVAFDNSIGGVASITSGGEVITYVLSNDDHTLIAYRGAGLTEADKVFTAQINDPTDSTAGYTFTLQGVIDHGGAADLALGFDVVVTDSDGDTDDANFTVTVKDDASEATIAHTIDEEGQETFNTSADATPTNTDIYDPSDLNTPLAGTSDGSGGMDYKTDHATVTVNANGTITYKPDANFSGDESFVFKTVDGSTTDTTTVNMTVNPVADAPDMDGPGASTGGDVSLTDIATNEDTAVNLGLHVPIIIDDATGTGNNPEAERLGEITLTLSGGGHVENVNLSAAADGSSPAIDFDFPSSGTVDIWITDIDHPADLTKPAGALEMTSAQYEGLQLTPSEHRSENIDISIKASSYEVDGAGNIAIVGGTAVPAAESEATLKVYVEAVTDDAELAFDTTATSGINNVDSVSYTNATKAEVTINEDEPFKLNDILSANFEDLDGSEVRSITIENTTGQTIMVDGVALADGSSREVDAKAGNAGQTGGVDSFPDITLGGTKDFSGDLKGINITINAQDKDSDGFNSGNDGNNVDGVAEANTINNSIELDLFVKPVAGDIALKAGDITTAEDTAVAFMENIEVTDTIVDGGTERITQVEFSLPTGWVLTDKPTGGEGSDWEITGSDALGYTITALASGYDLQTVLKDFTITPAPHSSVDETITVAVTSEDKNMVDGAEVISPTVTTNLDINVEVTAVAEELGPDLTMSGDYNYVTNAVEDVWFDLHQGSVLSGWENQDQDGSEETFALFTPALSDGINPVSANGSEFRYSTDGGATFVSQTYNGTAIEVPIAYLDTLQYKAPQDFAGNFEIQVTAKTVDTDPDTSDQSIWTGGSATLSGIVDPVADEVNLAVSGRARGDEDTDIPLNIRVSTSDIDASETITLTLSDIPAGAQLMYDGAALTLVDDGKGNGTFAVTIEEFDPSKPMTVRPPEHSNENFSIGLSAVSVDESGGVIDTSAAKTGQVEVIVRGVADDASLTVANPVFTEADVDTTEPSVAIDGFGGVNLNQVITGTTLVDTDGSEKLTIKISGLEPEFHLVGGNFLGGTGTDRVWVLTQDQLANAKVLLPINFSGTVTANAVPITTENDGNAKSSPSVPLSFTVTPSIDETIKPSTSNLQEDSLHQVDFSLLAPSNDRIVDTDEELTAIWIAAADADTSDYTLYFGNAGKTLAQAVTDGDPGIVLDGSEYKITGAAISNVYAQGAPNAHGNFTFDVGYEITDPSTDGTLPATSERTNSTHTLEIEAVTDPATLVINSITADTASTTITGTTGVEAVENTALTVNVTLSKDPDANGNNERDYDGSETITKVFVDGVPAGVTIDGAVYIGNIPGSGNTGRWLLSGQPTGKSMTADETFDLVIGLTGSAANLSSLNQELSIRVATQDAGNSAEHVTSDSFTLTTPATFDDTNSETDQPAVIVNWADEPTFVATEDTSFKLSDALVGEITGSSDFAITITGLPAGTVVSGMTMTDSDGNPNGFNTWTVSGAGSDADLQALLGSIEVNLPEHWNSIAYAGAEFEFDTTLTTYAGVGDRNAADARVSQVVTPVTDAAVITISNAETVNEDATVEFTVAIDNPADSAGNASNLVDGKLYLQITETDMAGGTLSYGGMSLALQNIVGVEGVADGQYYVADLGDGVGMGHGTSVVVSYQPPLHQSGTVSLEAWAPTKETDAANTVASVTSVDSNGEVAVVPVNDGFDIQAANVSGDEDSLIELAISGAGLIDNDGSEEVKSVLLTGLPDDFLVYVSNNADGSGAVLADNAGANGWVTIPTVAGQLPPYIAVQPPLHWNGTASVGITALTGEKALLDVESSTTSFDIEVVPVADGLDIAPLNTSGTEGDIIAIDINPSLVDLNEAVNLQIEGLGEYAAFHLNGNLMTTGVSYDELTDTYTLNGLTEAELGQLGFVQSAGTYTVDVSAQTVDGTDVSTPVVTDSFIATINPVAPTAGDDTLLYGGLPIDAGAGDDTIQLRFGEDVTASDLASNLDNVEVLDLGVVGENAIGDDVAGLSIQDVLDITDSRNALKIDGDSYDSVFLKNSEWTTNNTGPGGYVTYTSTDTSATLNISDQITSITMVD